MVRNADRSTRELILSEIRRLAAQNGGTPPGKGTFARVTGITEARWSGVIWARSSDARADAGFAPNVLQSRFDSTEVLSRIIELCRELSRLPTRAEIKLRRRADPTFPSGGAVANHFPTNKDLVAALRRL